MKTAATPRLTIMNPSAWILSGLSIVGGLLLIVPSATAQAINSGNSAPAPGSSDASSSANSLSGSSDPLGSMFQLMHTLQQGQIRSPYEFNQDQQENLGSAAAEFRNQQIYRLRQPQQPTPGSSPATAPETQLPAVDQPQ